MAAKRTFRGTAVAVPDHIRSALEQLMGGQRREAIDRTRVLEYSIFARLHGRARATTRRRCIFLRDGATAFFENPALLLHEYCHVLLQWETGELTVSRYLSQCLRRGYWNNGYERQARAFAARHLARFQALLTASTAAGAAAYHARGVSPAADPSG